MKDLFTGALGRLNNHGGSRIYTTPNTILVPPEYEIEIGEHGIFISCSLDGRLWLFEDRIIALKWNKEAGKMEYATSKSFSDENFVACGRDWILTDKSVIQITDSSPYIFHETHNENVTPMEHFYSLLPALNGFQIVKNYLIRKPDADYKNLMYHISMPDIYLTFYGNTIYARNNLGIGTVNILNNTVNILNNEGGYSLNFNYNHNFSDNSWQNMGIAFIDEKIYGFKNKENNKSLCPCSENNQLYSLENSSWSNVSDNEGNIFFDPFNRSGIMIDNKGINLLASKKSIECKWLSQWIAPTKQIQSIDDNTIISSVNDSALATYLNSGFYRSLLLQKTLTLTAQIYDSYKLSLGLENSSKININRLKAKTQKLLIALRVANPPNKQWFELNEILDYTGIIIIAEYSDGTTRNVTQECIFTPDNGTIATNNIDDITASYTENGVTKSIKLNQLELKIEFSNIFDTEIYTCDVEQFFTKNMDSKFYLPIFKKAYFETYFETYFESRRSSYTYMNVNGYTIAPVTGELIDINFSVNGTITEEYREEFFDYFYENDGTIGISIFKHEYDKPPVKFTHIPITHIPIENLIYLHEWYIPIQSIDKESQKINFIHHNSYAVFSLSSFITIQGLKELMEEYPFSKQMNLGINSEVTCTRKEGFTILCLSKKKLDQSICNENDNDNGYTFRGISVPTKILTFKTKIVPSALAINKIY